MSFVAGLVIGLVVGLALIVAFVRSENARSKHRSDLVSFVSLDFSFYCFKFSSIAVCYSWIGAQRFFLFFLEIFEGYYSSGVCENDGGGFEEVVVAGVLSFLGCVFAAAEGLLVFHLFNLDLVCRFREADFVFCFFWELKLSWLGLMSSSKRSGHTWTRCYFFFVLLFLVLP